MAMYFTGPNRDALREIAEVSGNLAAGNGGADRYKHPASGGSALPDYQRADLKVICLTTPHRPVTALVVTGMVLFGFLWEDDFARLGITGDLAKAFELLQTEFGLVLRGEISTPHIGGNLTGDGLTMALAGPRAGGKRLISMTLTKPAIAAPTNRQSFTQGRALPSAHGLPALPGK